MGAFVSFTSRNRRVVIECDSKEQADLISSMVRDVTDVQTTSMWPTGPAGACNVKVNGTWWLSKA